MRPPVCCDLPMLVLAGGGFECDACGIVRSVRDVENSIEERGQRFMEDAFEREQDKLTAFRAGQERGEIL